MLSAFINGNKLQLGDLMPIDSQEPDGYDLHEMGSSQIVGVARNANTFQNKPQGMTDTYCIIVRLASSDANESPFWGTTFVIQPANNKVWVASWYSKKWSDWREI